MAKYKTPEQVKEGIRQINPELVSLYEIAGDRRAPKSIRLKREETTILYDQRRPDTKYEVRPIVNGRNLNELFRAEETVIDQLSLIEAVTIAEYAVAASHSPLFIPKLEEVIKEPYTKIKRSHKRTGSKTSFPIGMHRP